jgi:DNA-binding NarL/FixJ family response regulator
MRPQAIGLGCWMDIASEAGDWEQALEVSAELLGADAMCLGRRDQSGVSIVSRETAGAPPLMTDACTAILLDRAAKPNGQRRIASDAVLTWLSLQRDGRVDDPNTTLFALSRHGVDMGDFQQIASVARSALAASTRIDAMRCASVLKGHALDQMPAGVAIVNRLLCVEEANQACGSIFARGDGLNLAHGRILCRSRRDQALLTEAVSTALADGNPSAILPITRTDAAQPYVVRAIVNASLALAAPRHCLLLIVDPDSAAQSSTAIWRAMFDLTECELRIAEGMVSGLKIAEIAHQRGVSVETVRSQTKRMFERLNVSSQAAAAALLSRTAPFREMTPAY